MMKAKVNEFGEYVCICGDEVWDHSMIPPNECVFEECGCEKFRQAYN